jgi:hypothetical protein
MVVEDAIAIASLHRHLYIHRPVGVDHDPRSRKVELVSTR